MRQKWLKYGVAQMLFKKKFMTLPLNLFFSLCVPHLYLPTLISGRWFKDSCQDPQLTMLNVLGKPDDVIVTMENGTELADGEILGPYTEGSNLKLKCHAVGGRPIPEVTSLK